MRQDTCVKPDLHVRWCCLSSITSSFANAQRQRTQIHAKKVMLAAELSRNVGKLNNPVTGPKATYTQGKKSARGYAKRLTLGRRQRQRQPPKFGHKPAGGEMFFAQRATGKLPQAVRVCSFVPFGPGSSRNQGSLMGQRTARIVQSPLCGTKCKFNGVEHRRVGGYKAVGDVVRCAQLLENLS